MRHAYAKELRQMGWLANQTDDLIFYGWKSHRREGFLAVEGVGRSLRMRHITLRLGPTSFEAHDAMILRCSMCMPESGLNVRVAALLR